MSAKLSAKGQLKWKVTAEGDVLTAEDTNPRKPDHKLAFNKYTEEMTPAEKAEAQAMEAEKPAGAEGVTATGFAEAGGEFSPTKCSRCTGMCTTANCKEWCNLRWCNNGLGDSAKNEADVKPAESVICKMCGGPTASEEKLKWCKE